MATARHRLSPSGPFFDGSGDGSAANIYSIENDATLSAAGDPDVLALNWEVPTGADGTFAVHWSVEGTAAADTALEAILVGTVELTANAIQVAEAFVLKGGANDPAPWFQLGGVFVRELAAGQNVQMIINGLTEAPFEVRRRRFVIYPVTVLT